MYSYYYIVKKDKINAIAFLNKAVNLPYIETNEKKKLTGIINQIEHPQPTTPKK